ncbi:MAG: SMC-Scp complex subunit ScpB [Gammaproteobacteria bacterium]|nr:SMC-Scp complex subunit ScpB [Gammaproteobacteria bacterium]
MDKIKLKNVVEAIFLASDRILSLSHLEKMLNDKSANNTDVAEPRAAENIAANDTEHAAGQEVPVDTLSDNDKPITAASEEHKETSVKEEQETAESVNLKRSIMEVIESLQQDYSGRAMELKEVASGYRFQVRHGYADYVGKLWEEKPSKYSRALLETLVLIAYRQPITRGEIEAIRGVSVSSHIIKTLVEREWVRVIGHRDVPGKPAIYGSTREFLDYFNLKSLDELPSLAEIKDLDKIAPELALNERAEELEAALTHAHDQPAMADASLANNKRTVEIRLMRRIRRSNLRNTGITDSKEPE